MKNKRSDLLNQLTEIGRNILVENDEKCIKQLQTQRKKTEEELQRVKCSLVLLQSNKKPKRFIGNYPFCFRCIRHKDSYVQVRKMKFCNDRQHKKILHLLTKK